MPWHALFGVVLRNMLLLCISIVLFYFGGKLIEPNTWLKLVICAFVVGVINLTLLWWIALNKNERELIKGTLASKLHLKR